MNTYNRGNVTYLFDIQGAIMVRHLLQRLWKDRDGQDLIEYALMAGFVAVAAGAIMPNVATSISTIFSQIGSMLSSAASQS